MSFSSHLLALLPLLVPTGACPQAPAEGAPVSRTEDQAQAPPASDERLVARLVDTEPGRQELRGHFRVRENRELDTGPWLELDFVALLATGPDPRPDPIVFLHGGPGAPATTAAAGMREDPLRVERDLLFVDQRGTGGNHALRCDELAGGPAEWVRPLFDEERYRDCLERLSKTRDLRQYTTPIAAHDLAEFCAALGYEEVNLIGGSYGTRMALVTMREHPELVRSAILDGVAPISFRNPLYHAWAAQHGLDVLLDECRRDPDCRRAFPELGAELATIFESLEETPATIDVRTKADGERVTVELSRDAFAESLRTMMYYTGGNRRVPLAVHRAFEGDFRPFAERALQVNRGLRGLLATGMLLSVTCPEDLARIDPAEIPALTKDTFLGDVRVRMQLAICEFWPQGDVGDDYGEPVRATTPTLLLSGTHDPVTPPRFGEEAASTLPNALHLSIPGCHGVRHSPCVNEIARAFLEQASVRDLDTSCVETLRMPPFVLR